ncbi:aromatic amino acid lyase [Spiractinospora alimapuensis]|uniref:aromatic amino acid ammonia-lyase n=1 Tax=Spiractinospora alimapuensis TaxID=2820884 RepID=UPI001F424FC7|nr:aromatic amino acid ammonia-lyase [Spiractinospora alimapuensis]QVQ51824.1 aromatic amino acid lyase [Spiractinospora alimapuensis]
MKTPTTHPTRETVGARVGSLLRDAAEDALIAPCSAEELAGMRASVHTLADTVATDQVYGVTRGFGALVEYEAAASRLAQGTGLISHLGTGQGEPLSPQVSRLVLWLRLQSMRRGFSAVEPEFWDQIAGLWNRGFTPVIPSEGTVSASGDLQPLAHAALAFTGFGEAWTRGDTGQWTRQPAQDALRALGHHPLRWPAREALGFVNGSSVSLAVSLVNHRESLLIARAVAALTARIVRLLQATPEAYDDAFATARGQAGQRTAARWIRDDLPVDAKRGHDRPLQEPYSLRCAPQVIGAVLDQLALTEDILVREAEGCTDNPISHEGRILHGGNFHALPVGLCSDQAGLALHQVAYLAERQLALLCSPGTNGGMAPMLTPNPGAATGVAGVQLSATSFVSRIRQLVYPASLTSLPTNGANQDHVPMALNGAASVTKAVDLAWLIVGSLAVAVAQGSALVPTPLPTPHPWSALAELSPPMDLDRPLAAEVRAAASLMRQAAETWVDESNP